jgi:predicted cobalt transporter CbtA
MSLDDSKRSYRNDFLLAAAMVAGGLAMCALALAQLSSQSPLLAQATQPLQSSPPSAQDKAPAESKPGGERPTTPAPEPARPDAQAQKEGAKPALPPAPAEKMAPPIQQK